MGGANLSGQSAVLLTKHFNSMTSENDMKWDATEATQGNFTFANADAQVAFAKANNMRVRGTRSSGTRRPRPGFSTMRTGTR